MTITDSKSCTLVQSYTVTQPLAALSASTVATNVSCFGGSNGIINLTVTNTTSGAIDAKNIAVNDVLPAGLTLNSATTVTGSWTSPKWTIGTLSAGATATLTLNTTVAVGYSAATIVNTATVSSTTPELNPANNVSTATTTVNSQADLSISKVFTSLSNPVAGDLVTFTITDTNNGPSDAVDATFTDDMTTSGSFSPVALKYSVDSGSNWICKFKVIKYL